MIRYLLALLSLCCLMFLALAAYAAPALDPGADPSGFLSAFMGALSQKAWLLFALLIVVLAVWAFRRYAPWSWAKTDRAGAVLALVGGCAVVLASGLIDGATASAKWLVDGCYLGVVSAGGYAIVRKLIWPSDASPKPGP